MNELALLFEKSYGCKPTVISRAPGRLEILGNHTDYNEGFVLSAATEQATSMAAAPCEGNICTLRDTALEGKVFTIDLTDLDHPAKGDWTNYLKGVLTELRQRGKKFGAFNLLLSSTVPLSAGMSSSAALEMAFCFALKTIYGIELPKADWARVGQAVENRYLGLKSGLLDQFSSLFGKKDSLILCDFRKVEVLDTVPLPEGYGFLVANTLVKHNLVESDYNLRRESCERVHELLAKECPGVRMLRDVDHAMLKKHRSKLDITDYRRALHVVGENERVMAGVEYLRKGDVKAFGELLFQSHESSRMNFENSCPELDALVEIARSLPECLGARLSGGGFGGITIHLIRLADAESYRKRLESAYRAMTGKEIKTILCAIGDGAFAEKI
ncbi:MAG: galactokinase [Lentisphaeria bacterium]|nr:galactokinase [Lentisphaeria bacterium]